MRRAMRALARLCAAVAVAGALAGVEIATAGMTEACHMEPNPEHYEAGAALGYCSGFTAKPLAAGECRGCSGAAFALCNGVTFTECACELPSDYSLDSGTFEAETPVIEEGGLTPFDATGLPCCKGNTVFEIPSSYCPSHCAGVVAYAICEDNAYTECNCDIPERYSLPGPDFVCDGG
jgi:hypothetical protein